MFADNSTVPMSGTSTFTNNTALQFYSEGNGCGGILTYRSTITISGISNFTKNVGQSGGGVYASRRISGSLTNNRVFYGGGGVAAYRSTVTISGTSTFASNTVEHSQESSVSPKMG